MKDELLKIIYKERESHYWNISKEICHEVGSRKSRTPMVVIGRFEILRVSFKFHFS